MKKIIRFLGVTLAVVVLTSCDPKDGVEENPIGGNAKLEIAQLMGDYKYSYISVREAVDLNGDGVKNNDLTKEGYYLCTVDNYLKITDKNYSYLMNGVKCDSSEEDLVFTYKLDKAAATITLYEGDVVQGLLTDVYVYYSTSGNKSLNFKVYNNTLGVNVSYTMAPM